MTKLKRKEHPYLNKFNSYLKRIDNKLYDYACGLHTDVKYDDFEQIIRIGNRIDNIQEEIRNLRWYLDPDYIPKL